MWRCPNCSETVERHFDICWNCGADKTGAVVASFVVERDAAVIPHEAVPGAEPQDHRLGDSVTETRCRFWTWPPWFIAVAVMGGLWLTLACFGMDLSEESYEVVFVGIGVSLFVPGAIRRRNVKHVLAMCAFGTVAPFLTDWVVSLFISPDRFLLWYVLWPAAWMTLIGVVEWLMAPGGSIRVLAWIAFACQSATAGFGVLFFLVRRTWETSSVAYSVSLVLMALVTWIAVPWGFRLASSTRRRAPFLALGAALTMVTFCVFMFTSGIYSLAKASLLGYGPYSQRSASLLLDFRGRESDYEFIFDRLCDADWSKPDPTMTARDWRKTSVEVLIRHDEDWATARLADLLVEQPSRTLIDMTDGLFVEKTCYETVPIYMRYALADSREHSYFALVGANRYKLALQELGVPHVVHAWLIDRTYSAVFAEMVRASDEGREPNLEGIDILVSNELRMYMVEILGEDAGPHLSDWEMFYEARIESLPTPLSEAQQDELERVIRCDEQYIIALAEWRDFVKQTTLQAWVQAVKPTEPDWDVPTTGALEEEVMRFVRDVKIVTRSGREL